MNTSINVMTFNTYLLQLPPFSIGEVTRENRVDAMLADDIFADVDIVLFQEVFSLEKKLLNGMKALGFIHQTSVAAKYNESIYSSCNENECWNMKSGSWGMLQQVNSGLAIASRHPILLREYQLFNDAGCGADRFSARGGVHVVINIHGQLIHVINTHMQSDDSFCITSAPSVHRKMQLSQLISWSSQFSNQEEHPIILGGDFNIDFASVEYREALDIMQWQKPEEYMPSPSWDYLTNDLIKHASPSEMRRWHLDYVFAKNVKSIQLNTRVIKSPKGYSYKGQQLFDYSDHYPVVANILLG